MSSELAALQIYSSVVNENVHAELHAGLAGSINLLTAKLLDCLNIKEKIALNYGNDNSMNDMLLAACMTEFNECLERVPTWEILDSCTMKNTGKEIFVALTDRLTDKVSGMQRKLTKFKNIKKTVNTKAGETSCCIPGK
jgi:hypothetical protein